MAITVYSYPKCSTCRKALAWLGEHDIEHRVVHIVDHPPSAKLLGEVLRTSALPVKALFNTSGESYREGGFKDKLPQLSERDALAALARDGKLVKRPLLVSDGLALVGFREEAWAQALLRG
jgi:arsenate reductase